MIIKQLYIYYIMNIKWYNGEMETKDFNWITFRVSSMINLACQQDGICAEISQTYSNCTCVNKSLETQQKIHQFYQQIIIYLSPFSDSRGYFSYKPTFKKEVKKEKRATININPLPLFKIYMPWFIIVYPWFKHSNHAHLHPSPYVASRHNCLGVRSTTHKWSFP